MSVEEDKLKASNGDILVPNNNLYPTEIDINASKVNDFMKPLENDETLLQQQPLTSNGHTIECGLHHQSNGMGSNGSQNVGSSGQKYQVYPERWWILACVTLVYGGNYCHWIAYPSVGKVAAKYYNQTGEVIDMIPTLSTGTGIPLALIATYLVDSRGIKTGIHTAAVLTAIGEGLCLLSSIPWVDPGYASDDTKYYLALIGQALTGMAAPFITCLPTKISQHWFGNNFQRTLATTGLTLSAATGLILGHSVTPLFVVEADDIPLMNLVWFIPAFMGSVLALLKIRRSLPPTAPSRSAELQVLKKSASGRSFQAWLHETKAVMTNPMAVLLIFFVSAGTSHSAILSTKLEQLMCSRGYYDLTSGLAASTVLIAGLVCATPIGYILHRTGKRLVFCLRMMSIIFVVSLVLQAYYLRLPGATVGIFASLGLFGAIAFGTVATAQEVLGECTYPVDQTIGLAWISMFGFVQGTAIMFLENIMGWPLQTPEELEVQVCVAPGDTGHQQPKDHSSYIYFFCSYMAFATIVFGVFFKTKLKRTLIDQGKEEMQQNEEELVQLKTKQEHSTSGNGKVSNE